MPSVHRSFTSPQSLGKEKSFDLPSASSYHSSAIDSNCCSAEGDVEIVFRESGSPVLLNHKGQKENIIENMSFFARRRQQQRQKRESKQRMQRGADDARIPLTLTPETESSHSELDDDLAFTHYPKATDPWLQNRIKQEDETTLRIKPAVSRIQPQASQPMLRPRQVAPEVASAWLKMGDVNPSLQPTKHPAEAQQVPNPQNIFRRKQDLSIAPRPSASRKLEETLYLTSSRSTSPSSDRHVSHAGLTTNGFTFRGKQQAHQTQHNGSFPTLSTPLSSQASGRQSQSQGIRRRSPHQRVGQESHWNGCLFSSSSRSSHHLEQQGHFHQPTLAEEVRYQTSLFDSPSDRFGSPAEQRQQEYLIPRRLTEQRQDQERNEAFAWRTKRNTMGRKEKDSSTSKWRTAVDPKSGKTYYYHTETRETQWRKPMELASTEEQEAMEQKEQKQRDFFAAMEANILRNLQTGALPSPQQTNRRLSKKEEKNLADAEEAAAVDLESSDDEYVEKQKRSNAIARPNLVRTISSMDEKILKDIVMRVPSHRNLMENARGSSRSLGLASDESIEELIPTESTRPANPSKANSLRLSMKQASIGAALATLPEDQDASLNSQEDFTFGDESMFDMGLSEEDSAALLKLSNMSIQMSMVGEESLSELDLVDEESSSEEEATEKTSPTKSGTSDSSQQVEDPLAKMDLNPRMARSKVAGSQRMGPSQLLERPTPARRNTCGTIYVGSTMAAPDIDATIKCVCGVIRAHILQSELDPEESEEYFIFNDQEAHQTRGSMRNLRAGPRRPSLDEITSFYRDVFNRAQMESDCVIMSLIYVERLVKCTAGQLRPRASNWRSIIFSSMVLASKVWDDLSMWNGDFSQTCPAGVTFSLQRINELELAVLEALGYVVKVPASEYAKYYFLLRSMLIKSGLGGDEMKEANPLDVDGARRLQAVSSKYQRAANLRLVGNTAGPRSKSLTIQLDQQGEVRTAKAGLEHLVDM